MAEAEIRAELAELRAQNQRLNQAMGAMQQQAAQQQDLVAALAGLPQALAALPGTVSAAVEAAASQRSRARGSLIDTKGLGRLLPLKNSEQEFVAWARRTENFVASVFPGAREVLAWAVELDPGTAASAATAAASDDLDMEEATAQELSEQLYSVLMSLVEGESFDIIDPLTTGRARGLLREILSPGRAKLAELQGAVERLEDLMRRYALRRDARTGERHHLAEGIRMAALEALLPEDLEKHCQLQRARLDTYAKLREEVILYAEARGYVAPKLGQVGRPQESRKDDPMDVGQFNKGAPKGGKSKGKYKGKDGKGKDAGALEWDSWDSPAAASWNQLAAGPTTISATPWPAPPEPSVAVSTVDLCAAWDAVSPAPAARAPSHVKWVAINVDTGAGGTVWPADADYAGERAPGLSGRTHRIATGELVEGQGRFKIRGVDAWGHNLQMVGEQTSVHKPLLSVGDVTDKGHAVWLDGDAGYIFQRGSPIPDEMRAVFSKYSWGGVIELNKERGVYNLYVQVETGTPNGTSGGDDTIDVSPNDMEGELPEVGADYACVGPEGSQVALLRCKCKRAGCLAATQVPAKGVDAYALSFIVGWQRSLGWERLIMRSDNERALLSLLRAAAMNLEGVEVIEQACPEGDHAANGLAEVAAREVKAQTRVLKSHLEQRLGRPQEWTEPLATWLVRHAANCLSRYRVQADGRAPDQRRTGRRWRRQVVEFGERAKFHPVAARREARAAGDVERMLDGIFVGLHERTGAALFLSDRGLLRGTRVQRKTPDQQWDNEYIRHTDECRSRMDELMARDADAGVQHRLHQVQEGGSSSGSGGILAGPSTDAVSAAPAPDHIDGGVPMASPAGPNAQAAGAADSDMSASKLELVPRVAVKIARSAAAIGLSSVEVWSLARVATELSGAAIAETYSPNRFTSMATSYGLKPSFFIDVTAKRDDDAFWDLGDEEDQRRLEAMQEEQRPDLLIGSPPCTSFSALLQHSKTKGEIEEMREEGRKHVRVCIEAYKRQLQMGQHFLHEHPAGSASWDMPEMQELLGDSRVYVVQGPMCRWGMVTKGDFGKQGYVRQEIKWATSSPRLAALLAGRCPGEHRHVRLLGKQRAAAAAVYPPRLVKEVLREFKKQVVDDGKMDRISLYSAGPTADFVELDASEWQENDYDQQGNFLDPIKVKQGKQEEIDWVLKQNLFDYVPERECKERQGRPCSLKWEEKLEPSDVISAMPLVESLKELVSHVMTERFDQRGRRLALAVFDASRAHFYGTCERDVYVQPLAEPHRPGFVAKLNKTMYGTHDASNSWQRLWGEQLRSRGYTLGASNPALFRSDFLKGFCHGDDFMVAAAEGQIDIFEKTLSEKFELRRIGLIGAEEHQDKELEVLRRTVRVVGPDLMEIEADQRHVPQLLEDLGLKGANAVKTPRVKLTATDAEDIEKSAPLEGQEATRFRRGTMRCAYLSQDRVDISESVKCLSQAMARPRAGHMVQLKRLARYLNGVPRRALQYAALDPIGADVIAHVDSDWAGDPVSRRSTTGVILRRGKHLLRHSSTVHNVIGLSSAESEYYALTKGGCSGLGLQSHLADWGLQLQLLLYTDSSSARAAAARRGVGKNTRRIQTRMFWLQERAAAKHLRALKVATESNPADMLTKALPGSKANDFCETVGQ
ncbi:unnamed protein product, partial [Prorocentrum cordatum]